MVFKIMKSFLIILLLFTSYVNGQNLRSRSLYNSITKEDSLVRIDIEGNPLKAISDTLLTDTLDELNGWRKMKIVSYYYDSLNTLRKIAFTDNPNADYYFYFEGSNLKEARVIEWRSSMICKYSFTNEDNASTIHEIERKAHDGGKKDFYDALRIGKSFFEKFKAALSEHSIQ